MKSVKKKSASRKFFDSMFRFLRTVIMFCIDSSIVLTSKRKSSRGEGAIFCLHGLGDLLLTGNAIAGLSSYLNANDLRAVLFVHPDLVEFARQYLPVDQVEGIDRHAFSRQLKYRKTILKSVARRFAIAVQPTYNRMLRVEDCLVRATGAARRIGNAGHAPFITSQERRLSDRFYTQLITTQAAPVHELRRNAAFLAQMGLRISENPWKLDHVIESPKTTPFTGKPYLVVAPHASQEKRSWPLKNFLIAAYHVAARYRLNVVLIDGENPSNPVCWPDEVRLMSATPPDLIDLCGKIPTRDIPAVVAAARLVICNDSGIMHLGASLDRPTIAVGGSGMPVRYFPYPEAAQPFLKIIYRKVTCGGCDWKCIYTSSRDETVRCMSEIAWEEVVQAVQDLMDQLDSTQIFQHATRI